jgi:hypothetical protein
MFSLLALAAIGCSLSAAFPRAASPEPSSPTTEQHSATRSAPFLGHLAVKGMSNDNRTLMTSIVVRPKLWEPVPYVLIDENSFGETYNHGSPMAIDTGAIRSEARRIAELASAFWGGRSVHVMVNTEGWPLQWDIAPPKAKGAIDRRAYNRKALAVYGAIQDGIERGWPTIDRFGWWSRMATPYAVERRDSDRSADALNLDAAPVWRRSAYFSGHIYPFARLVAEDQVPGQDEAHAPEWAIPVHEAVGAMIHLRDALGGDQLVLPCMFGTSQGWSGKHRNQPLTEQEQRLLVRASHDAGADGILVWQPIRSEAERDEFQRAIVQIESELARINGVDDPGPAATLGQMFGTRRDWPGRPKEWMRTHGAQSAPERPGTR